jgi:hypothetical protein
LETTEEEGTRRVLARIARDECRHAELAWKFVAWGSRQLGPPIVQRLRVALAEATVSFVDDTPACDDLAAWHQAGRLSREERRSIAQMAFQALLPEALSALNDGFRRSPARPVRQSSANSKR